MTNSKKEECYYWPLWFSYLFSKSEQKRLIKILPKIQTAQIFLWRALNIYDDLLDGDCEPNEKLITANNYYYRFLSTHFELKLCPEYYKLLNKLILLWESSNRKEIKNRKLSLTKQTKISVNALANKSLVLAAGPLALIFYLNYNSRSLTTKSALKFWLYFLSAKQLSDDSRDWEGDLKNNILTFANAPIAIQLNEIGRGLKIEKDDVMLNAIFIQKAALNIISNLKDLTSQAKMSIKKINGHKSPLIINKLILPLEEATCKSENFLKLSGLYLS